VALGKTCLKYLYDWRSTYELPAARLGLSRSHDEEAARLLSRIIGSHGFPIDKLRSIIENRIALVFGAGPSLDHALTVLEEYKHLLETWSLVLIAADTATRPLMEHGFNPNIIVTDLDVDEASLLSAVRRGTIMLVHAHSDNVSRVKRIVPILLEMQANIIGTTQTRPLHNVFNFGGFTDGDRAVHLAVYMGASRIIMIGMDLGYIIGRRSAWKFNNNPIGISRKLVKLQIAGILLERLACSCPETPIFTLYSQPAKCTVRIDEDDLPILIRG
jgi:uncharacterized Rossmann fold enzyme